MNKPLARDSSPRPLQDQPNRLIRCTSCNYEYTAKSMTPCPHCAASKGDEFTNKTVNDSDLFK